MAAAGVVLRAAKKPALNAIVQGRLFLSDRNRFRVT
jgi:hypothetical protein